MLRRAGIEYACVDVCAVGQHKEVGAGVIVRRMLCMTCRAVGIHQLAACAALTRLDGDVMMNDDGGDDGMVMMVMNGG